MRQTTGKYHVIEGVVNPSGSGATVDVKVVPAEMDHLFRRVPRKAWEVLTAEAVLKAPTAIYRDLRLDSAFGGWCYVGRPERVRVDADRTIIFPDRSVYAAFLNKDLVLFDWGIQPCDPNNEDCIENHEKRFGELAWPKA